MLCSRRRQALRQYWFLARASPFRPAGESHSSSRCLGEILAFPYGKSVKPDDVVGSEVVVASGSVDGFLPPSIQ